jgi:hypothetical protein
MAKGPVEVANPQQYLRLLLLRLLETQKALQPFINRPEMVVVKRQFQENAYILSEIRSWLEAQDETSPLGPSLSSARVAEKCGPGLCDQTPSTPATETPPGERPNPFAWRTSSNLVPVGTSQVRSSLPSECTLPDTATILRGTISFRPPCFPAKPPSTSAGGQEPTGEPSGNTSTGDKKG